MKKFIDVKKKKEKQKRKEENFIIFITFFCAI